MSDKQRITINTLDMSVHAFTIGRAGTDGVQLGLDDPYVSTRHLMFRLTKRPGTVRLTDLGSTNGVVVNGRKMLSDLVLSTGTHQLRVGHTDIELMII